MYGDESYSAVPINMRPAFIAAILLIAALLLLACAGNPETGMSEAPQGTFLEIACLDVNGDHRVNGADAADPAKLPDVNGDGKLDASDGGLLFGVDVPLVPGVEADACGEHAGEAPEFLVAYKDHVDVSCDGDTQPMLILGVGGGVVNLRERSDAAGVRELVNKLLRAYADRDVQTLPLIAGPGFGAAEQSHLAMEDWLTHAVRVYLQRYPCLRAVLLGHSHGAVSAEVVVARLEQEFADRIALVVDIDRVTELYNGTTDQRPSIVPVFNIYELNDFPRGAPFDAPNVENWDASDVPGPEHGEKGGKLVPVTHTTIDNSDAIHDRILQEVLKRS